MEQTAMRSRSDFEDTAELSAYLAQSPHKPWQLSLRGCAEKIAAMFAGFFAQKKSNDSGQDFSQDFPMGDQVKLPEGLLEAVSKISAGNDRREANQSVRQDITARF